MDIQGRGGNALRRHGKDIQIAVQDETGAVSDAYCLCRNFKVPRKLKTD